MQPCEDDTGAQLANIVSEEELAIEDRLDQLCVGDQFFAEDDVAIAYDAEAATLRGPHVMLNVPMTPFRKNGIRHIVRHREAAVLRNDFGCEQQRSRRALQRGNVAHGLWPGTRVQGGVVDRIHGGAELVQEVVVHCSASAHHAAEQRMPRCRVGNLGPTPFGFCGKLPKRPYLLWLWVAWQPVLIDTIHPDEARGKTLIAGVVKTRRNRQKCRSRALRHRCHSFRIIRAFRGALQRPLHTAGREARNPIPQRRSSTFRVVSFFHDSPAASGLFKPVWS